MCLGLAAERLDSLPSLAQHFLSNDLTANEVNMITQDEVKKLLDYNPETGEFRHKKRAIEYFSTDHHMRTWNTRFAGKVTGTISAHGYVFLSIKNKLYTGHRIAFLIMNGYLPEQVDHINGDRSDNRILNLRPANNNKNQWNTKAKKGTKIGIKGVSEARSRKLEGYRSRLTHNGKTYYLGVYTTPEEAGSAFNKKAEQLRSEWIRHE